MSFELRVSRQSTTYLERLDRRTQQRVLDRPDEIAIDPDGVHTKALINAAGRRSARVGDIRIVFSVDDVSRVVSVSLIGPRGRAYRNL